MADMIAQRTLADAKSLLVSIERDWDDLASRDMTQLERQGVLRHMLWAKKELVGLFEQLDAEDPDGQ